MRPNPSIALQAGAGRRPVADRLRDLIELANVSDERKRTQAVQGAYEQNAPALMGNDPQALTGALIQIAQAGDPGGAMRLRGQVAQQGEAQKKAAREELSYQMGFVAKLIQHHGPERFEEALGKAAQLGVKPEMIERGRQLGYDGVAGAFLDAKDQMDAAEFRRGIRDYSMEFGEAPEGQRWNPDGSLQTIPGYESRPGVEVNIGNVDYPTPPSGFDYVRETQGDRIGQPRLGPEGQTQYYPVEGGPAALEEEQAQRARSNAAFQEQQTTDQFLAEIEDIEKAIKRQGWDGWLSTGWPSLVSRYVPDSAGAEVASSTRTIVNLIGFGELKAMREASTSGASGLGQLTERELTGLQSLQGELRPELGEQIFTQNLSRVKERLLTRRRRFLQAYVDDLVRDPSLKAENDAILSAGGYRPPTTIEEARRMTRQARINELFSQGLSREEIASTIADEYRADYGQ